MRLTRTVFATATAIAGGSLVAETLTLPANGLPAGAGREIAAARCVRCHDATRLATPGQTRTGWSNVVEQMRNIGVELEAAEVPALVDYLAANYPERTKPAARVIPGDVQVAFKEWPVATTGAFPHDPLATGDGMIWYAGQRGSLLGRIDPVSGAIREFATPTANSGPHGLTADVAGNIWFTANYAGYIGKLDPKTGSVTEYSMPDTAARDPHTPVFDQRGVLWFTVQAANRIGRLTPATGEIRLAAVPTPRALPYGKIGRAHV